MRGNPLADHPDICAAFTKVELLVVVMAMCVLLGLSLPALTADNEAANRNSCQNNLKQIALALLNYEDKRHCLPPISSNIDTTPDVPGDAPADLTQPASPGSAKSSAAGYSWMVFVLPDIEEVILYQSTVTTSKKFILPAFSPKIESNAVPGQPSQHPATAQLAAFLCPSYSGARFIDTSPRTAGVEYGDRETGSVPPNYVDSVATANGAKGIAITNYNAIAGTHIDPGIKSVSMPNNGGMLFRGPAFDMGRKLAAMTDGTSKVPVVAETREQRFSSWYDGTMNWVVAARHSNPAAGTVALDQPVSTTINAGRIGDLNVPSGRLIVGTDGTTSTGGAALSYGPTAATPTAVYLPTGAINDPDISGAPPGRLWGPSSEHRGGIVNHAFADGHVDGIADTIDPNIYLWIVTRNGGEPIPRLQN